MRADWKTPLTILLCSLACLAYQVVLTRIFSITLWYHFAFMIISIAMLGLAASGTALALWPKLKALAHLDRYCLLLGFSLPLSCLAANRVPFDPVQLAWEPAQLLHVGLLYLVLAVPFFCNGLVIATAYSVQSARAPLLYGADLLGAGCGSLGVLLLMSLWAPERTVFLLALAPLLTVALAGAGRGPRALAVAGAGLAVLLFAWAPEFTTLRISPYKGLPAALRYPGAVHLQSYVGPFARVDSFESPAARFAPGLSLRWLEALPHQAGLAIDGGEITALTAVADRQALAFLGELPSALPYAVGHREKVLILDPGGGLQLLVARHVDAGEVVAVERHPEVVEVIRRDWREFTGALYPARTATGMGRSWLRGGSERFDIIDIALPGVEPSGSYGINEDFRFTVEAFREYLDHLRPDGLLSVNLYLLPPPRSELRLLATLVAAMAELGITEPARHLAVVRSWGTVCLLAKRSPFTAVELARIESFAVERWFDPVHLPPSAGAALPPVAATDDFARAVAMLLDPHRRDDFLRDYPFAVAPVRDDAPFFHYFLKPGRFGDIYRLMGGKWSFFLEAGGIVPAVLIQVALLSLLLVMLPLRRGAGGGRGSRGLLPYFALLGSGFMLVETVLIQRLILPLEYPAMAVAAVLAALLVSCGAGSLLSHYRPALQRPAIVAIIAVLVVLYNLCLPDLAVAIAPWPLPVKLAAVFLLLFPLGMLIGMPFPCGLRLLGERTPQQLPWAWAINGCCSVVAPIVAILLATVTGFAVVMLLGAAAYGLAALNLWRYRQGAPG